MLSRTSFHTPSCRVSYHPVLRDATNPLVPLGGDMRDKIEDIQIGHAGRVPLRKEKEKGKKERKRETRSSL